MNETVTRHRSDVKHPGAWIITRTGALLAISFGIQWMGLPQPVTGPIVNATLIIAATGFGWLPGIVIGILTPLGALLRGQLPPALAVMAPFIGLANLIFVTVFLIIFRRSKHIKIQPALQFLISIVPATFFKYGFLVLSIKIILRYGLGISIPPPLVFMLTTPQIFTALAGGLIAYILNKKLRHFYLYTD